MIATLFLWIRSNRLLAGVLGLAGAALALVIAWQIALLVGGHREKVRQEAAAAQAIAKAEHRNSDALEASAVQRRIDDASSAATEKELNDAVESLPDAVPSARRVALGCARLRRAGQDVSGLPQCS